MVGCFLVPGSMREETKKEKKNYYYFFCQCESFSPESVSGEQVRGGVVEKKAPFLPQKGFSNTFFAVSSFLFRGQYDTVFGGDLHLVSFL